MCVIRKIIYYGNRNGNPLDNNRVPTERRTNGSNTQMNYLNTFPECTNPNDHIRHSILT